MKKVTTLYKMKIGMWNVGGIGPKKLELLEEMEQMKIDILVVTEKKKKGKGSEEVGKYYFIYLGIQKEKMAASGIGIMIKRSLKKRIIPYSWVSDRIVTLKLRTGRSHCLIIGVYDPLQSQIKVNEKFYTQLQKCTETAGKKDYIMLTGDLNAIIGDLTIPKLIGPHVESILNENGQKLRDFCTFDKLRITNTFFKHRNIHKYTSEARSSKSTLNYVIVNEKIWPYIADTRAYSGVELDTDHYIVMSKVRIPKKYISQKPKKRTIRKERYKIQQLEELSTCELYQNRLDKKIRRKIWRHITRLDENKTVSEAAFEALGVQHRRKIKRLKMWNEELKQVV
jgi:hypothetical protein